MSAPRRHAAANGAIGFGDGQGVALAVALVVALIVGVPVAVILGVAAVLSAVFGNPAADRRGSSEASRARRDVTSGEQRSRMFSGVGRLLPADVRDESVTIVALLTTPEAARPTTPIAAPDRVNPLRHQ
ncbi:hypothetical protein CF165_46330 [Amycolatopsis vastitatis]|uniref:Uncharacterized protein n=1 Tax=Amycolatopsis vastitatis TaxID=1905142 RepID=A0A229SLY7_9PSEU|nr:hypothetical protein CF165_46330 [Amycolatopsis vastitatis]